MAKMLATAAYRLGLNVAIIDKEANTPAGDMTKLEFINGWNNRSELDKFIDVSDIITLENEFIEPDILEYIASYKEVFPTAATMRLVQDKFIQKSTLKSNNINSLPVFKEIFSINDLHEFGNRYSYPFIAKTRTLGYDGYGNFTIHTPEDCAAAYNKFNNSNVSRPLMAESFVNFKSELAVMVARNRNGETAVYPCVETVQQNHICHKVIAPARIAENLRTEAQKLAVACVDAINGIGVFGVEMFLAQDEKILINEIAPRPHNSGHYTIESCHCSQYENAIRAILNLPLGSPQMRMPAACMINLLGERNGIGVPCDVSSTLADGVSSLHLYNKKSSRIGRKMGHITALGSTMDEAIAIADNAYKNFVW